MSPLDPPGSPIAGVLLAAGLSTRMGRPKQLALLAGRPLCRFAAQALADAGHSFLLAVIPPGEVGEQVRGALDGLGFGFIVNPEPARGLASSFRVAARALPGGLVAVNFALADMPLITADVHRSLLAVFRESGAPVVLAEYGEAPDGVRAPPHLFRADLLDGVRVAPDADHGPRGLIQTWGSQARVLHFPAALLLDVDTPDALAQAELELAGPRSSSGHSEL